MFPYASFVDDATPGAAPMDQLRLGASRLPRESSGLLITHVGVAKVLGAPFRTLCPGEGLDRDVEWLTTKAGEQEVEVGIAKLFARIELRAINYLADPTRIHGIQDRRRFFACVQNSSTDAPCAATA